MTLPSINGILSQTYEHITGVRVRWHTPIPNRGCPTKPNQTIRLSMIPFRFLSFHPTHASDHIKCKSIIKLTFNPFLCILLWFLGKLISLVKIWMLKHISIFYPSIQLYPSIYIHPLNRWMIWYDAWKSVLVGRVAV